MSFDPLTAGVDLVKEVAGPLIKHFFPDPSQQAQAELELAKLEQSGQLQVIAGQLSINLEEAKSTNWFVAGWRPAFGWIGALAVLYSYIVLPFAEFFLYVFGSPATVEQFAKVPHLDLGVLWPLVTGMLGIGAARTFEKVKGAEGNR